MTRPALRGMPALFLGMMLSSGCASVPKDAGFSDVQKIVHARMPERIAWDQGNPNDAKVARAVTRLLAKPLDARAAVQIALLNNRDLQATYEDLGIAQADLVQAGLLSNPVFGGAVRFPLAGGQPEFDLGVTQDLLDIIYMPLKKRVAKDEFEAAKQRVADDVIGLAGRTRVAFYRLVAARQLKSLHARILEGMGASYDAARRLRDAGNITELELDGQQAMYEQAQLALAASQQNVADGRERLDRLMGLWGSLTEWHVVDRLPGIGKKVIDTHHLERRAIVASLDLAAARERIIEYGHRLGLAKSTALVPSLGVGAQAERLEGGGWTVGPSLGVQIPIFDQGQARVAKARAQLRRLQQRYVALAVRIRSRARAARQRLQTAREMALYYERVYLPLEQRIVHQSQLQYNAMQIGVFRLLFAREQEIDAAQRYVTSLRDYWISRTRVDQLLRGRSTGLSMSGISGGETTGATRRE